LSEREANTTTVSIDAGSVVLYDNDTGDLKRMSLSRIAAMR
jgi:hypothetical protein